MHSKASRFLTVYLLIATILASSTVPTTAVSTQLEDLSPYTPANETHGQPPSGQWLYFPFSFDATVNDIWADDHGGVWLATSNGLALFDGDEFTMFFEGLNLHTVGGDNKGHLVASNSFGRAHFFKESTFETYDQIQVVPESDMEPIPQIESVLMDSKGNTWFACLHQGLARYSKEQLEWIEQPGLSFIFRDLIEGHDGTIWVVGVGNCDSGNQAGVASYHDDSGWKSYGCSESGLIDHELVAISVDQQGHVWVLDNTPFIFMFDGSEWVTILNVEQANSYNINWPSQVSRDIWTHNLQNVWLAQHLKLSLFDGTKWWSVARMEHEWRFMPVTHRGSLPYGSFHLAGDQQGVVYTVIDLLDSDYNTILESGLLVFVPPGAELRHYTLPETPIEEPSTSLQTLIVRKEGLIPALESPSGIYFLDFPIPAPGYDEASAHQLVDYLSQQQKLYEDGALTIAEQDSLARQTAAFERFVCQEDITSQVYPHYASTSSDVVHSILEMVLMVMSYAEAAAKASEKITEGIPFVRELIAKQNEKLFDFLDSLCDVLGHRIEDEQDREAWDRAWDTIFKLVEAKLAEEGVKLGPSFVLELFQDGANVLGTEIVLDCYVDSTQGALDSGAQRVWDSADPGYFENTVRGRGSDIDDQIRRITLDAQGKAEHVRDMREGVDDWADDASLWGDLGALLEGLTPYTKILTVGSDVLQFLYRGYELATVGIPTLNSLGNVPHEAEHYCFDTTSLYQSGSPPRIHSVQIAAPMLLSRAAANPATARYLAGQRQALQQSISDYQEAQRQIVEALGRGDVQAASDLIPDLMRAEDALTAQFRAARAPILASAAHLGDADFESKYQQMGDAALDYDGQMFMLYVRLMDCLARPDDPEARQAAIAQAGEVNRAIADYQQSIAALDPSIAHLSLPPNVLLAGYTAEGLHVDLQVTNASPAIARDVMVTMEDVGTVTTGDLGGGETKLVAFDVPTPGVYVAKVEAEGSDPDTLFVWVSGTHSEEAGSATELASNVLLGVGGVFLCTSLLLALIALWMRRNAKRQ